MNSPGRRRARLAALLILAALVLLLDTWSKYAVGSQLGAGRRTSLIPGRLWIEASGSLNRGALLGIGRRLGSWSNRFFALTGIAAASAILYWSLFLGAPRDWLVSVSLSLILGGALGNVYDRLMHGGVRDFIHVDLLGIAWPVFNLADVGLVLGAGLFLLSAWTDSLDLPPHPSVG